MKAPSSFGAEALGGPASGGQQRWELGGCDGSEERTGDDHGDERPPGRVIPWVADRVTAI